MSNTPFSWADLMLNPLGYIPLMLTETGVPTLEELLHQPEKKTMPRHCMDPRQVRDLPKTIERVDHADPSGRAREATSPSSQGRSMFGTMCISRVKIKCDYTQLNEAVVNVSLKDMPTEASLMFLGIKTKFVRGFFVNGQRLASIQGGGADFEVISGPDDDFEIKMDFKLHGGEGILQDLLLLDLKDIIQTQLIHSLQAQIEELKNTKG